MSELAKFDNHIADILSLSTSSSFCSFPDCFYIYEDSL